MKKAMKTGAKQYTGNGMSPSKMPPKPTPKKAMAGGKAGAPATAKGAMQKAVGSMKKGMPF